MTGMSELVYYVIPALLGRAYDLRNDTIGPDLFKYEDTQQAKVIERYMTIAEYKVAEEILEAKDFLDVTGKMALKLSKASVSGMGSYLKETNDLKKSVDLLIRASFETPFLSPPAAILTHSNSSAPSALPTIICNASEEVEEIEVDTEQAAAAVAPRVKILPLFIQPNPDWTDLMVFAHSLAPMLQSKLSGSFLRITVQSEEEYRKLATYFRHEQIEFKSVMLKSEKEWHSNLF
ncbi:UNVERIFIED_CONTAM: hypothetical protein NCL1_44278 [Trichonephila clavipes]